jgi:homocitrate synthase NifV
MPSARPVILKDSTLREGLDTPAVAFTERAKLRIADGLVAAGVAEAEVVAPSRVGEDLSFVRAVKRRRIPLRASGLIYANGPRCAEELDDCGVSGLDRVDLLMPLSEHREPRDPREKIERLLLALAHRGPRGLEVGVGFPHSMQAESDFLLDIASRAVAAGATRVTVYDTNGGADPSAVGTLVRRLVQGLGVSVFFHGHNDLGLATANSWSAVLAGAAGLDVTVNGLGDRAGNASLEQVAALLHVRGVATGVKLPELPKVSRLVARLSGVAVSPLAPVVGAYVFTHKSPSHLTIPTEFEAFDPGLIGGRRRIETAPRRSVAGATRRHS